MDSIHSLLGMKQIHENIAHIYIKIYVQKNNQL